MSYLQDPFNWDLSNPTSIPNLFFAHVGITLVSLAIALVIAFPIALLVARYQRLYTPVIGTAGFLYTLPSLALLALLIPVTGLNPPTVIIPLVAYAQIVLIRNIVAAIRAVDPQLVEVGRAMGMNGAQTLLRVTLPLALPVIIAGLRVAMVTSIGIATIGYLVGVQDLGYLIFQGVNLYNFDQTIAGAIVVTAFALGADLSLLGLQAWLNRGRGPSVVTA